MQIHIDGDFPVKGSKCKYYCSPSCHPAQIDPDEWKYGCTHVAWEQNLYDFCPLVLCDGDPANCEIERWKLTRSEEIELFGSDEAK